METSDDITQTIINQAKSLGFDAATIIPTQIPLQEHAHAYHEWIFEGRHGAMSYLDRNHELRIDPKQLEPGTRSAVVVLKNYNKPLDLLPGGLRIARYAHGDDYHDLLRDRLRQLGSFIHAETGANVSFRPVTDSAPLLERTLAQRSGLGWIGKNSMLIHPQIGSFTLIAELLLDIELDASPAHTPNRCGRCTSCIDKCPTQAIVSPYILDARRCISYLTIEFRGPIPRHLRPSIQDYLFGCDICQDVCPWNRKAPVDTDPQLSTRDAYLTLSPEDILLMSQHDFSTTFRKSPIKRTKRRGLARNAAVVLGNRQDPELFDLLSTRLPAEEEPLVQGHIIWAIGRTNHPDAHEFLQELRTTLSDPYLLEEIDFAMTLLETKR